MTTTTTEEIKSLQKLYKFLKKNTNQLGNKTFLTFVKEIVEDNIFDKAVLLEVKNTMNISINSNKKTNKETNKKPKLIRIMNKVFKHKQKIKHNVGKDKEEWIAYYDKTLDKIIYKNKIFDSLNKFTQAHFEKERPFRNKKNNAWLRCQCLINDEWISTYNLPELIE